MLPAPKDCHRLSRASDAVTEPRRVGLSTGNPRRKRMRFRMGNRHRHWPVGCPTFCQHIRRCSWLRSSLRTCSPPSAPQPSHRHSRTCSWRPSSLRTCNFRIRRRRIDNWSKDSLRRSLRVRQPPLGSGPYMQPTGSPGSPGPDGYSNRSKSASLQKSWISPFEIKGCIHLPSATTSGRRRPDFFRSAQCVVHPRDDPAGNLNEDQ